MQYTLSEAPVRQRDLSDIAGTWQEDPEFDQAIAEQDQIDEQMWRQGIEEGDRIS